MPFEHRTFAPKRIAIVGGGISGMAAAYHLSKTYPVTLYEAEARIGGHARTVIAGKNGDQPVDTGFIVFNHVNYPHLVRLFEELEVPTTLSDMGFAASFDHGALEYSLKTLDSLFAQRKNIFNPRFLRMVRDLLKWNARAAQETCDPNITLGEFCAQLGLSRDFQDLYLGPISGAIWSTPSQDIMAFPARPFVQFFKNHALLSNKRTHQWHTVQGGSIEYVRKLEARLITQGVDIRKSTPVMGVRRIEGGVEIRAQSDVWEAYDEVVFATHSDQTLALLTDASAEERKNLSVVRYQPNTAVLHADATVMPKRKKAWASWVYSEMGSRRSGQINITYWMNSLQPIPQDDPLFVTLNAQHKIPDHLIYDEVEFAHPQYDFEMMNAVGRIKHTNGQNNTWFCGAWMRNGFHEDGYASAMDVVNGIEHKLTAKLVAE